MKFAYDAKRIFCNKTGLGNYGRTLVKNFHSTFPDEEIILFTPKTNLSFLDDEWKLSTGSHKKIKVITPQFSYMKKLHSLWRSFYLSKDIEKESPQIYHGLSHELPTEMSALSKTTKTVVTIHDLIYLRYPSYFPLVDRVLFDAKFRYATENADSVIAICEQTARDLQKFYNTPRDKITVLHQAIDELFYIRRNDAEKSLIREKYQLPQDFLLFVGTIEERKNPLLIIEAMKKMGKNFDIPLVIIGNGKKYKKLLIETIKRYKLEDRVLLLGHIDFKDLSIIYQMAKIFIFPSHFEGFGLPVVEALASGTPVITSHGSSFPEAGGDAARFINPEDVDDLIYNMELVLTDSDLREEMIKKGLEHVKKFDGGHLSQSLMTHYKKILKN